MTISKVINLFVSVISIFSVSNILADTKKPELQKSISSMSQDAHGIDGVNSARQRPAFSRTEQIEPMRPNKVNKSQLKSESGTFIKIDGIDGESIHR